MDMNVSFQVPPLNSPNTGKLHFKTKNNTYLFKNTIHTKMGIVIIKNSQNTKQASMTLIQDES